MTQPLMDRKVLVTGAATGIGRAIALELASQGAQVAAADIQVPTQTVDAIRKAGGQAVGLAADVSQPDQVQDMVSRCVRELGGLDGLVNNAGIYSSLIPRPFEDIDLAEHARILQINVQGLLNMTHMAFPFLRATANAQVINMGSASGHYGVPHLASYSASKFAVRGLTEALDLEWAKHGIRVADLMPPFVSTPMLSNQRFQAPIMRRMGVNLEAEAVAQVAWAQTQSRAVHRPISLQFKLLYWFGQLTPAWMTRRLMAWLSRE